MTEPNSTGFVLGNKFYDRAKFLVQVFLPALGVLYATIAATFGIGGIEQVLAVLAAIGLFVGTIMRISSNNFTEPPQESTPVGTFIVTEKEGGGKAVQLEFDRDPEEFIGNDNIVFKTAVQTEPAPVEESGRGENSP